jgi:hypothetical protein
VDVRQLWYIKVPKGNTNPSVFNIHMRTTMTTKIKIACEQCIVTSMCNEPCDNLEKQLHSLIPYNMKGCQVTTAKLIRISYHDKEINDIRVFFPNLTGLVSTYMLIVKGKIVDVGYNEPNKLPSWNGWSSVSYSKRGFKFIITHECRSPMSLKYKDLELL